MKAPDTIRTAFQPFLPRLRRVGHEAGALSLGLHPKLLRFGLPTETAHDKAAMG